MNKKTVRFDTPKFDGKNGSENSTTPLSINLEKINLFKEGKSSNNVLSTPKANGKKNEEQNSSLLSIIVDRINISKENEKSSNILSTPKPNDRRNGGKNSTPLSINPDKINIFKEGKSSKNVLSTPKKNVGQNSTALTVNVDRINMFREKEKISNNLLSTSKIKDRKNGEKNSTPLSINLDRIDIFKEISSNNTLSTAKTNGRKYGERNSTPLSINLNRNLIFKEKGESLNNVISTKNDDSFEPSTPKAHIEFSMELKKVINERNILTSKTRKRVFDALDEIKTKGEEESRVLKKEKALLEIINSEIKYVRQLETIMIFFKEPAEHRKLLKPEDFQIIFGNIETIYRVNKELLDELLKGSDNVTNAFSKIGPFLKLYSVYASEFKHILNMLQNARCLYPQFAKFVENQESRPEVQSKLSALLITPIQRVPRYKLLLTQINQLTKPTEKDYIKLTDCLEKINDAAEHINKVIEDQENMQRLLELQRCIRSGEPNIIKPGRKLIKEGILVKMSTKDAPSEKLYTVLMNDIIMFLKMKKDNLNVNSLKCISIFPLSKSSVIEVLDKGCLKIICQEEELILYHNQFSETKSWSSTIKEAIESHLSDRKTLRKDSSSRRPVKRKDLHEYHEVGLSPGRPMKKRKNEPGPSSEAPPYKIARRPPVGNQILSSSFDIEGNIVKPTSLLKEDTLKEPALQSSDYPKDLFIFGRPQVDQGFKFGKFLGGVSVSLKRMLGFKR